MQPKHIFISAGLLLTVGIGVWFYPSEISRKSDEGAVQTQTVKTEKTKTFNAQAYTLKNGLQIVVVENHRAPVVTHMVWYRVGAADEPRGKSGIAHFLEHLMFKGHKHEKLGSFSPGEFSKTIRALGGEGNAFTSQDYTAYYQSISKDHLETVMKMEAGRMRGLAPPMEEVKSEHKVIQEERRQRIDNQPRAKMAEQAREALFPNHPYSTPVIGWMNEINNLTWEDAKAFYDQYYAPNNAILVVSGDVKADEVYALAQKTYGLIDAVDTPERARTQSPDFNAQTRVTLQHDTIKEPHFTRTYRVPSYRQNAEHALALQVLEEIMAGGSSSRLYKSLVVKQKQATNASLYYSTIAWNDATLSISATPTSVDVLPDVEAEIDAQLREIIENGVTEDELTDSVERLQAEAIYARDSLSGPAMIIGYNLITGASLDDVEYWPYHIERVTADLVQEVARLYLNPDTPVATPPVDAILLPNKTAMRQAQDIESETAPANTAQQNKEQPNAEDSTKNEGESE